MKTHTNPIGASSAFRAAALAVTLTLLGGCNNDDDDAPNALTVTLEVPTSATVSVTAWTQFAASLPASESTEPVRMNTAEPPTSETAEPQAL